MNHSPPPPDRAGLDRFGRWPGLCALGLFLALLFVYGPALGGKLLWDDAGHVTAPALRSLGGLARIWLEAGSTQQYYPVLHSAFWLEHKLWGDATLGYHVMNVLQHAGAAFLFACLLRKLAVRGALFAAVCFALHPVSLNPGSADTHLNLAVALRRMGRGAEAEQHLAEAQRLSGRR